MIRDWNHGTEFVVSGSNVQSTNIDYLGAVGARVALAHAKGELSLGEAWTYQSLLSNSKGGRGSFVGSVIEEMDSSVRVKLEGFAYYTGSHTFIVEEGDMLGDEGFTLDSLRAE